MEKKETYTLECKFCGRKYNVELYPSDVERYESGEGLIQDIFPYLSADMREILISGMGPCCFPKC